MVLQSACQSPSLFDGHLYKMNKTLRYLNPSTCRMTSLSTRSKNSTLFQLRTMASDLEVLILIPAALHSFRDWPHSLHTCAATHSILLKLPPQSGAVLKVVSLLQVHKTHSFWVKSHVPSSILKRVKSWSTARKTGWKPYCYSSLRGSTIIQTVISSSVEWTLPWRLKSVTLNSLNTPSDPPS